MITVLYSIRRSQQIRRLMKSKELFRVVTFRVPLKTYDEILDYAHQNDVQVSTLIRRLVLRELPARS